MDRREFLTTFGIAAAGVGLFGVDPLLRRRAVAPEEICEECAGVIDMSTYIKESDVPEYGSVDNPFLLDWERLVNDEYVDPKTFSFTNTGEEPVLLDFSSSIFEQRFVQFEPHRVDHLLLSNITPFSHTSAEDIVESYGSLSAVGLSLVGSFFLVGPQEKGKRVTFLGKTLDRTITCTNGPNSVTSDVFIQNIEFDGIKSGSRGPSERPTDIPVPAAIAGDDVNLSVDNVLIDYTDCYDPSYDETSSQLPRGIILNNSQFTGNHIRCRVTESTVINGIWDAITVNGYLIDLVVDHCELTQVSQMYDDRGAGISTTQNVYGSVYIADALVHYAKGGFFGGGNALDSVRIVQSEFDTKVWALQFASTRADVDVLTNVGQEISLYQSSIEGNVQFRDISHDNGYTDHLYPLLDIWLGVPGKYSDAGEEYLTRATDSSIAPSDTLRYLEEVLRSQVGNLNLTFDEFFPDVYQSLPDVAAAIVKALSTQYQEALPDGATKDSLLPFTHIRLYYADVIRNETPYKVELFEFTLLNGKRILFLVKL